MCERRPVTTYHHRQHALLVRVTGSTDTSLWTHYAAGEREYCGNTFPDGMRKNDRLESNVITPTTKAASHDVPISAAEIVRQGLMTPDEWDEVCCLHSMHGCTCSMVQDCRPCSNLERYDIAPCHNEPR
jgi:SAICAR synthetase